MFKALQEAKNLSLINELYENNDIVKEEIKDFDNNYEEDDFNFNG